MRKAAVTVCEAFDGGITILHHGRSLSWRVLAEGEPPIQLDDEKSVQHTVDQAKVNQLDRPAYKPAPDHPWNKMTHAAVLNAEQ